MKNNNIIINAPMNKDILSSKSTSQARAIIELLKLADTRLVSPEATDLHMTNLHSTD